MHVLGAKCWSLEKCVVPTGMTKKRKPELDLDVERNLHSSFVTAANSISHLFTQAIQQNKKAQVAGAQHALVSAQTPDTDSCSLFRSLRAHALL